MSVHSSGYLQPYYTYSQNGVAYLYNNKFGNNKFDTLFNINAQIGDKWRFPLIDTTCADSVYFMEVLNSGTKTLNGFSLKWLQVATGPFPYGGFSTIDTISERFGYRYDDLFYSPCTGSPDEGNHGGLRCYSDDAFGFYSTNISSSCDYYYTGISYLQMDNGVLKIYPNPANDKINIGISLEQGQTGILMVYDLRGKLVLSEKLDISNDLTEVCVVSLKSGLYIYKLTVNETIVNTGKLNVIR